MKWASSFLGRPKRLQFGWWGIVWGTNGFKVEVSQGVDTLGTLDS